MYNDIKLKHKISNMYHVGVLIRKKAYMMVKRIGSINQKKSLKQYAYDYIKGKILDCTYRPNTFLNEQQLCDEMGGLSRTPVRDALGRLEQEGLVNIRSKKGVMVSELRLSDINRIYEVRELLEPYALRKYGDRIDTLELERFRKLFSDPNRPKRGNTDYYDLDDQFHGLIVGAMPNRYLLDTYDNIRNLNRRFRVISGDEVENRIEDTFAEHLNIVNACLRQDLPAAVDALRIHLEKSRIVTFQLMINSEENI